MNSRLLEFGLSVAFCIGFVVIARQSGCLWLSLFPALFVCALAGLTIPSHVILAAPFTLCVWCMEWAGRFIYNTLASRKWPTISGTIIGSQVGEKEVTTRDRTFMLYRPRVHYQYEVNGKVYDGRWVSYANRFLSWHRHPQDVQQILSAYPVGSTVSVRYNSNHPHRAVLSVDITPSSYLSFAVGGIGALVSGWIALYGEPILVRVLAR